MTLTIGWWAWPALLVLVGMVVAVVDYLWDSANSGGDYASIGNGCMGACVCALCCLVALGLVIGKAM